MSFKWMKSALSNHVSSIQENKAFSKQWNILVGQLSFAFVLTGIVLKQSYSLYQSHKMQTSQYQPHIVIIGAGMSGICAAIRLKTKLNYHNFIIYERDDDIGGTWKVNDYPGCKCDIQGVNYSLWFDTVASWTPGYYPPREETLNYLKDMCKKYKLYPHIQFNSCVNGMQYDETSKKWHIAVTDTTTKDVEQIEAHIVISAVGLLSDKKIPKFKDLHTFKGKMFHSSEWDHKYSMTDKKVGIVGSGSTAAQVISALAKMSCEKLFVFQRSIAYVVPNFGAAPCTDISRRIWSVVFKVFPFMQSIQRYKFYRDCENNYYPATKKDSDEAKDLAAGIEEYRKEHFGDNEALMQATKPSGKLFTKRLIASDEIFSIYKKENLCEVITADIDRFVENGIRCKDGRIIELDCIALCTGFRAQEFLCSIEKGVIGKKGKHLQKDVWDTDNCFAYLGITVSDFPNLFMIYGPGTNLGHYSVLFTIECAVEYIILCIEGMIKNQWNEMDVKHQIMSDFVQKLDEENNKNAWQGSSVESWYRNDKGRGSTNWAYNCQYYWSLTKRVNFNDYNTSFAEQEPMISSVL